MSPSGGSAVVEVEGGEPVEIAPGETVVRVGPAARRRVVAGPDGVRMLVIGGVPAAAYTVKEFTELGAADPAAS